MFNTIEWTKIEKVLVDTFYLYSLIESGQHSIEVDELFVSQCLCVT